jgi:hypothetical protein
MAEVIITCIGGEGFAKEVYDYLYAGLEGQTKLEGGRRMVVNSELVLLEGDEIRVDSRSLVPKGMIKWALESLLKSDPACFKDYRVIEFGDTFTIGLMLHPSRIEGMHSCELCGYFTPYAEELYTHRMTHYGGFG